MLLGQLARYRQRRLALNYGLRMASVLIASGTLCVSMLWLWAYQNNHVRQPVPVQISGTAQDGVAGVLKIYLHHQDFHALAPLIARFNARYDRLTIQFSEQHHADIWLGKAGDTAFYYAKQKGVSLAGNLYHNHEHARLFRDFLLSSPAQDLLVQMGLESIEPYKEHSSELFSGQSSQAPANISIITPKGEL